MRDVAMIAFAKDHHICLFKQSEYVFYGILSMFLKACLVLRNSSLCVCREMANTRRMNSNTLCLTGQSCDIVVEFRFIVANIVDILEPW